MEEGLTKSEIIREGEIPESRLPQIVDNLGIEVEEGLLDVETRKDKLYGMLMKGIGPDKKGHASVMAGRLTVSFGGRSFSEVFQDRLRDSMEKRGVSIGPEEISYLGRLVVETQELLSKTLGWKSRGAYFHDEMAPFFWFDMKELSKDYSLGEFMDVFRHEVGHWYEAIEDGGRDYYRANLVYLGTYMGVELFAGLSGLLVCRTAERVADRNKKIEIRKERKEISRRQFLKGAAAFGAGLLIGLPAAHKMKIEKASRLAKTEEEATRRGQILGNKEIMDAFVFKLLKS